MAVERYIHREGLRVSVLPSFPLGVEWDSGIHCFKIRSLVDSLYYLTCMWLDEREISKLPLLTDRETSQI